MNQSAIDLAAKGTPRREAVRAVGAAGTALLGVLGMNAADAKGKQKAKADKKGKRGKRGKRGQRGASGPSVYVVLGITESFTVEEDVATAADSSCPFGSIAISANIAMSNANCALTNSAQRGTDTWQVAVYCPAGSTSTDNSVQAICLVIE